MSEGQSSGGVPDPGLCGSCVHRRWLVTARGTRYLYCRYSHEDPAFRRYPELPVRECSAHVPGEQGGDADA